MRGWTGRCRLSTLLLVFAHLLVFATAALIAGGASPAHAAGDCTTDATLDAEEKKFLVLINNHRAQNGLPPLVASYKLTKASQWKSTDMGANSYFAHNDQFRSWSQRIRDCGYGYNTWLAENIAAGVSTAQAAFDLWKNSAGHNANMLSSNYTAIGIGRANVPGSPWGWYWTTDFGGVNDGWASAQIGLPTPVPTTDGPTPSPTAHVPTPSPTATSSGQPPSLTVTLRQARGHVVVLAAARDDDGIDRVEFYVGGRRVRTDRHSPYVATIRRAGTPAIVVVAIDRRGNSARSVVVVPR